MGHDIFHNRCIRELDQLYVPVSVHINNAADRTEAFGTLVYRTACLCREHPMGLFILWAAIWDKLERGQEFYEEYIGFHADGVDDAERMAVRKPPKETYLEVWKLTATKQGIVTLTYMSSKTGISDRLPSVKQKQGCVPG